LFRVLLALVLFPLWDGPVLPAQTAASREYQIKAAFLLNFAQFVEWPPARFASAEQPFSIGILGDDPFGPALEQTVQGETIHNHRLVIQRSPTIESLKDCQLIFVSRSEKGRVADILSKLDDRDILTVSEIEGFARRGGIINFYLEGNKVRFEINPVSAQRDGLKISSQLLSLGKIVKPSPARND
jgi:hypothetical protein